jgi:hypothetical protein
MTAPSWVTLGPRSWVQVLDQLQRVSQRRLQPGTDPVSGQFQVQVHPGNGPCFFHKNGAKCSGMAGIVRSVASTLLAVCTPVVTGLPG